MLIRKLEAKTPIKWEKKRGRKEHEQRKKSGRKVENRGWKVDEKWKKRIWNWEREKLEKADLSIYRNMVSRGLLWQQNFNITGPHQNHLMIWAYSGWCSLALSLIYLLMHYGMLTDSNIYDTSLVDITRVSVIVKSLIRGMISTIYNFPYSR